MAFNQTYQAFEKQNKMTEKKELKREKVKQQMFQILELSDTESAIIMINT